MYFLQVSPTIVALPDITARFNEEQEAGVNLTPFVQKHYQDKARVQTGGLVEILNLTIPAGSVVEGVTYLKPELVLQSSDIEMAKQFAISFFDNETTELFSLERNKDYDVQDL